MVIALVALFISLTGSAIAVNSKGGKVPPNSVGPKQLKSGAVTAPDVAQNAITGAAIAQAAVNAAKLAQGAVTGDKIQDGSVVRDDLSNQAVNSQKIGKLPGAAAEEANTTSVGGSSVQLSYDFEQFDFTGDMYDNAGDPAKMVAPRDGLYQVTLSVVWQAEAGTRKLTLVKHALSPVCNCEFDAQSVPASASGDTPQTISSLVELEAGDAVSANADSTGDDGSTDIITTRRPRLTMMWLAPLN
jgi:hypothetical protein